MEQKKSDEGGWNTNEGWRESGWEETPIVTWERHLVITKREDSWPRPSPLSAHKIYLSLGLQTSLSSFLSLSSCKHSTTTRGGKKKRIESRRRETLIYMPLGNLYGISLSCAIVYCVWLSNEKNGKEKGWAGCWAIKAAFRVVACQHGCLYALTNLVIQTHNHPFTQAQRHSSAYTSNSGEGPNHT